jgi:hypothetical protein
VRRRAARTPTGPSPGEHSHGRRVLDGVGEERRRADARLAPNHQATASRRPSLVQNGVDRRALRRSAGQHGPIVAVVKRLAIPPIQRAVLLA